MAARQFFFTILLLCLSYPVLCINFGNIIKVRLASNRAQVFLHVIENPVGHRYGGANLINRHFLLGNIAGIMMTAKVDTTPCQRLIYARIGSLKSFDGGELREINKCELLVPHEIKDPKINMLLARLRTPYYSPQDKLGLAFMAVPFYRPRETPKYSKVPTTYQIAGWHGVYKNVVGQTLTGLTVRETHIDNCDGWYTDLGEYKRRSGMEQPMGCFVHRKCTDNETDCVNYQQPGYNDDGNGLYLQGSNLLVGVLKGMYNKKQHEAGTLSGFVSNIQVQALLKIIELIRDEYSEFPEYSRIHGIF